MGCRAGGCILFERHEPIAGMSGNAAALAMSQAIPRPRDGTDAARPPSGPAERRERLAELQLVHALGARLGVRTRWRGTATASVACGNPRGCLQGMRWRVSVVREVTRHP